MSVARDPEPAPDTGPGTGAPPDDGAGEGTATSSRPVAGAAHPGAVGAVGLVFGDPLDRPSSDDTDRGWGDAFSGAGDDDFTRFLNEKPPHHL
jgi:acetyl-CoA synthetase